MNNQKGFTVIDLLMSLAIILIIFSAIVGILLNNRKATEERALSLAKSFTSDNNINAKRISCAGDYNNNGYGSCSVVTDTGEKLFLECPTDYFDIALFGASQCKEVFQTINLQTN